MLTLPQSGQKWGLTNTLSVAGGVLGAAGSLMAGFEQARSLKAQAKVKQQEAAQTAEQGIWQQIRMNEDARRMLSTQRQLFGQAGVRLEGAPMELMQRTQQELVLERMMHGRNVAANVSALYREAKELKKAARSAKRQGIVGAFSSFF